MDKLTKEQAIALLTLLEFTPVNRLINEITAEVRDEDFAIRLAAELIGARRTLNTIAGVKP